MYGAVTYSRNNTPAEYRADDSNGERAEQRLCIEARRTQEMYGEEYMRNGKEGDLEYKLMLLASPIACGRESQCYGKQRKWSSGSKMADAG